MSKNIAVLTDDVEIIFDNLDNLNTTKLDINFKEKLAFTDAKSKFSGHEISIVSEKGFYSNIQNKQINFHGPVVTLIN